MKKRSSILSTNIQSLFTIERLTIDDSLFTTHFSHYFYLSKKLFRLNLADRLFIWHYKARGWTITDPLPPNLRKCVMIVAPHTSAWDFVYGAGAKLLLNLDCKYLAKKELFKFPIRGVLLHLGGVPVDRNQSKGMVDSMIQYLKTNEEAVVLFPPEGTRKRAPKWKTGFYYAALGANVPIVLSFIDYGKKRAGFGPSFIPSGDYEKDLQIIRDFYSDITAFYPENFALPE